MMLRSKPGVDTPLSGCGADGEFLRFARFEAACPICNELPPCETRPGAASFMIIGTQISFFGFATPMRPC